MYIIIFYIITPYLIPIEQYSRLAGFPPFMGDNLPEIVDLIVNGDYEFPSPYWDTVSGEAKDFVSKLLVVDPSKCYHPSVPSLQPIYS